MFAPSLFSIYDKIIGDFGTNDPEVICSMLKIKIITTLFYGYICYDDNGTIVIGVYKYAGKKERRLIIWHELTHYFRGDLDKGPCNDFFPHYGKGFDDLSIEENERVINILAIDRAISTSKVLKLLGTTTQLYKERTSLIKEAEHLYNKYLYLGEQISHGWASEKQERQFYELEEILQEKQEQLSEIEREFSDLSICKSLQDLSIKLGYPVSVISYKVEALRLKGLIDITPLELDAASEMYIGRHFVNEDKKYNY